MKIVYKSSLRNQVKYSVLLILTLLFFFSCEKGDEQINRLRGTWVETLQRSDTLIFGEFDLGDGQQWLELKRENMTSSGPYNYYFFHDSISLQWALSSCLCRHNYYFSLNSEENTFLIGNFYRLEDSDEPLLSFQKVN